MAEAIGIDPEMMKKVDALTKEEFEDRSTVMRKLLRIGLQEASKEKSAQLYREGKITLTEAAHRAGLALWDFPHYLIDKGFVSSYSIEEIEEELIK